VISVVAEALDKDQLQKLGNKAIKIAKTEAKETFIWNNNSYNVAQESAR
jgi:hypothetical protein